MDHAPRLALDPALTPELAERFAHLVLAGIGREYPNQPGLRLDSDVDLRPPREVHPAFYGCFDWHSAVHGHWLLVRLVRLGLLSLGTRHRAESALREHLSPERLAVETSYFLQSGRAGFEWPYGWAWLLALEAEVSHREEEVAEAIRPLADLLAGRVRPFLDQMIAPQRMGQHGDTAFSLQLMVDAAGQSGREDLLATVTEAAQRFYAEDQDYPWAYEQGPYDFHSAGLSEACLMRRVLGEAAFGPWLEGFWPGLVRDHRLPAHLAEPVRCPDVSDGKLAHLTGLNLERARTLAEVAESLGPDHPMYAEVETVARQHHEAGLARVGTGHYAGDHWLATFALRLLSF